MKTSENGLKLIRESEGLKLKAYLCPAGKWTIGYGHTLNVKPDSIISEFIAEQFLKFDILNCELDLEKYLKVQINQNQYDALIDFIFNLGGFKFGSSTLLRKINSKDKTASEEILKWDKTKNPKTGKFEPLKGLTIRRKKEYNLFKLV